MGRSLFGESVSPEFAPHEALLHGKNYLQKQCSLGGDLITVEFLSQGTLDVTTIRYVLEAVKPFFKKKAFGLTPDTQHLVCIIMAKHLIRKC